jgi:hypothetical protein
MKLSSLIPALVFGLFVLGCDKDDDKSIRFAQNEYELDYGETLDLEVEASGISAPFEFTVENEDVASINEDGLLTAGLVGETAVLVSKDGESAECKVVVNPTAFLYDEPYLKFGTSIQDVKSNINGSYELSEEVTDGLLFEAPFNDDVRGVLYVFDSNKLMGAKVLLVSSEANVYAAEAFLEQRYNYEGYWDGSHFLSRGEIAISLTVDYDYGLNITYIKNPETKSTKAIEYGFEFIENIFHENNLHF